MLNRWLENGHEPPLSVALWHNCGSVFVVVNAALLLRLKDTDSAN